MVIANSSSPRGRRRSRARSALLLEMASKAEAHRGEDLVAEVGLASRREARVQRGRQNRGRRADVDHRDARPAAFARVGDSAREVLQTRALAASLGGEVE